MTSANMACLGRWAEQYHYRFVVRLSRIRQATPLRFGEACRKSLDNRPLVEHDVPRPLGVWSAAALSGYA